MADIWSPAERSDLMRRIKSKDTKPERIMRSGLHRLGYRFRIHRNDLPGKPDIVLPRYRTVIFVHGCFWHQHTECRRGRLPRTKEGYWSRKLNRNVERDAQHQVTLQALGWSVLVVWECEILADVEQVLAAVQSKLREP